jgi:hypothetical protein
MMVAMTQPTPYRYRIEPGLDHDVVRPDGQLYGLGRHVNHDPRSRRFPFRSAPLDLSVTVFHQRHIPIFDQGNLGSCTGNAALGILATGPYWDAEPDSWHVNGPLSNVTRIPWNEDGAVHLYSAFTAADDYPGTYPPNDTGSDGLTAAKVLTGLGIVPGYQHTFSLTDALTALQHFPLLVGTEWLDNMFYPDAYGRIKATGPVDGGHEWIVDEFVPAGRLPYAGPFPLNAKQDFIGGTTSWGTSFGLDGRFYLSVADFGKLLKADGDVIVLIPPNAPAPDPDPAPSPADAADAALATAMRAWLTAKGL